MFEIIKKLVPTALGILGLDLLEKTIKKKSSDFKSKGFQNKSKNLKRGEIRSAFHRDSDCWD